MPEKVSRTIAEMESAARSKLQNYRVENKAAKFTVHYTDPVTGFEWHIVSETKRDALERMAELAKV